MADVKFGFERDAYNYEIVTQVKSILDFYTMAGYDFTAHDITKQVRTMLGPKIKIDHEDVRKAVHIAMSGRPRYNKDTNAQGAILYKHVGSGAIPAATVMTSNGPQAQPIKTKPLPHVSIQVAPSVMDSFKNFGKALNQVANSILPKGLRKPDKRGSLTVPKKLLENVTQVGKWALKRDGNDTRLYPLTWSAKPGVTRYTKDKSGNIRVTKKHLPKAPTGQYRVTWEKEGEVLIRGV